MAVGGWGAQAQVQPRQYEVDVELARSAVRPAQLHDVLASLKRAGIVQRFRVTRTHVRFEAHRALELLSFSDHEDALA